MKARDIFASQIKTIKAVSDPQGQTLACDSRVSVSDPAGQTLGYRFKLLAP